MTGCWECDLLPDGQCETHEFARVLGPTVAIFVHADPCGCVLVLTMPRERADTDQLALFSAN